MTHPRPLILSGTVSPNVSRLTSIPGALYVNTTTAEVFKYDPSLAPGAQWALLIDTDNLGAEIGTRLTASLFLGSHAELAGGTAVQPYSGLATNITKWSVIPQGARVNTVTATLLINGTLRGTIVIVAGEPADTTISETFAAVALPVDADIEYTLVGDGANSATQFVTASLQVPASA